MYNERKILYISVAVNFVIGIVIGTVLFYGQMRTNSGITDGGYVYDTAATLTDFFRLSWINIIWLLSVFVAHSILPVSVVHPVVAVRGCVSSFSMLYILTVFGVREAAAAILPQCFSALPLIMLFAVEIVVRHRENVKNGDGAYSVKRYEAAAVVAFSILAGAAEVLLFKAFCIYLF